MFQKHKRSTIWLVCAALCACTIPLALLAAWYAYSVFIPDPCRYHPHPEHIEPSLLIELFFYPLDNMGHPEPNILYFATFAFAGIMAAGVLTWILLSAWTRFKRVK
jgi:hypothetical protein